MRLVQTWTRNRTAIEPWHAIPEQMAKLGLTTEDGMTQIWFVDGGGRLTGGAEAMNAVMKLVWWGRPFTILYPIPGIKQLQDWAYRWVANNRYRMPGSTAACALEPEKES